MEGGAIDPDKSVVVSYVYGTMRLDAVVLTSEQRILLRKGLPHVGLPVAPAPAAGEIRLANIWVPARVAKLDAAHLFLVIEAIYPKAPKTSPSVAEQLLPKTRFELLSEAWGGYNTGSYLDAPSGHLHNYQEKVLDLRPDLIVSVFVNDAGLNKAGVYQRYGRIRDDFLVIGAEWVILTPHYVRTDWMGLYGEQEIDDDPRPYVQALREFTAENGIALADASRRWGRLWRQGIPYSTLLMNNINHPNAYGMTLFADALLELFQ